MTKSSNHFYELSASDQVQSNVKSAGLTKVISCSFIMNGLVFEIMSPKLPFYISCLPLVMSSSATCHVFFPSKHPHIQEWWGHLQEKTLFFFSQHSKALAPKWEFFFCRMNCKCYFCSYNSFLYFSPKECEDIIWLVIIGKYWTSLAPLGFLFKAACLQDKLPLCSSFHMVSHMVWGTT